MPNLSETKDLFARHFAGDLDQIEARELTEALEKDDALQIAYASAYDLHVSCFRLLSFVPHDPDLGDCFSQETLDRYCRNELRTADREVVEAHLACLVCGDIVRALARDADTKPSIKARVRYLLPRLTLPLAAAAALLLTTLPRAAPLPLFAVTSVRGEAPTMDVTAWSGDTALWRQGTRFEIELASPEETEPPLEIRVFIFGGASVREWHPQVAMGTRSIVIFGEVGTDLRVGRGEWTVVIGLARDADSIDAQNVRAIAHGQPAAGDDVQYFVVPVEIK